MKRSGILLLAIAGISLGAARPALAGANCAQVNKNLGTGRTVQEVAETMVLSEDEVKKCQKEAQGGAAPGGGAAPAAPGAPAAPATGGTGASQNK